MNVKCFICSMVQGVAVSVYYCRIFTLCFWVFCGDVMVSDGTGGVISMDWNPFFQGPVGFTYVYSCAVVGWAFPVVNYVSFWASGTGSFGCMIKNLMVLVPLKKTLILYFARACVYCSLRPLTYGTTTLAPSINFPVDGVGFLLGFALLKELCWVVVVL